MKPNVGALTVALAWRDEVATAQRAGRLITVLGAGATIATTGRSDLTWAGALRSAAQRAASLLDDEDVARRFLSAVEASLEDRELLPAAEAVKRKFELNARGGYWSEWLRSTFGSLSVGDARLYEAVARLSAEVWTTNYDTTFEATTGYRAVAWSQEGELSRLLRPGRAADRIAVHLHGVWHQPETVVFSAAQYAHHSRETAIQRYQETVARTHLLLFVGFGGGLGDDNLQPLLTDRGLVTPDAVQKPIVLVRSSELERARASAGSAYRVVAYGEAYEELPSFLASLAEPSGSAIASSDGSTPPAAVSSDAPVGNTTGPSDMPLPASAEPSKGCLERAVEMLVSAVSAVVLCAVAIPAFIALNECDHAVREKLGFVVPARVLLESSENALRRFEDATGEVRNGRAEVIATLDSCRVEPRASLPAIARIDAAQTRAHRECLGALHAICELAGHREAGRYQDHIDLMMHRMDGAVGETLIFRCTAGADVYEMACRPPRDRTLPQALERYYTRCPQGRTGGLARDQ